MLGRIDQNNSIYGNFALQTESKSQSDSLAINKNSEAAKSAKRMGYNDCQTWANRMYQDGSSDPGVSFKSPTHVSPAASGGAVNSHESEHVNREKAKAAQENREVVSQSVQVYVDTWPECGRRYTSGGKTTTVTRAKQSQEPGKGTKFDHKV